MKNLRNLFAAIAIGAVSLLPITSSAQSVTVYHRGERVNVGRSLSNRWRDIKSGVKYNTYKMSHGGRTSLEEQRQDARREAFYNMNNPSMGRTGVVVTTNGQMSRALKNRFSDIKSGIRYNSYKLTHGGRTSLQEQRQDARREELYRARLNEQR